MTQEQKPRTYVRVDREFLQKYCHLAFSQVLAAAERKKDGLRVESPGLTQGTWERPTRCVYKEGEEGDQLFEAACTRYDASYGAAFLYEGEHSWPADKTLMYQQNW